ncbi:MAG: hypothetical protein LBT38_03085 [Deltaproteobacteria bacterium]|nr:hypothetical protein [Deltaproteobacteria bacterium]
MAIDKPFFALIFYPSAKSLAGQTGLASLGSRSFRFFSRLKESALSVSGYLIPSLNIVSFFTLAELEDFLVQDQPALSEVLIGPSSFDRWREDLASWLKPPKTRPVIRLSLGLDKDYFYPLTENYAERSFSNENSLKWQKTTIAWIKDVFTEGPLLVERQAGDLANNYNPSPLIHLWLPESSFRASKFKKCRYFWPPIIKSYALALACLGQIDQILKNWFEKPTAKQIASYYQVTCSRKDWLPATRLELESWIKTPELSLKDYSDAGVKRYLNEARALTFEKAEVNWAEKKFAFRALEIERERVKVELIYSKNKLISFEKKSNKYLEWGQPNTGIEPAVVLSVIYKAKLVKDYSGQMTEDKPSPYYSSQGVYLLKDGTQISVDDYEWQDLDRNIKGVGVFSLIKFLSNYDEQQTFIYLLGHFSVEETQSTLGQHYSLEAPAKVAEMLKTPFELPETTEATWPTIRTYFLKEFKFPEKLVDEIHASRKLLTTERNMIVFNCDEESGAVFMFRQKFNGQPPTVLPSLPDSRPWSLTGPGSPLYLTDNPVEAMSLKALYPDNPVIVFGERAQLALLKPYLTDQKAVIASRSKKSALSRRLKELELSKLKPPMSLSWTEFWLKTLKPNHASSNGLKVKRRH